MFSRFFTFFFILIIRFYQKFISPLFPRRCCFYPTCSQYFVIALKSYGIFQGLFFSFFRLLRCHPWSSGGVDFPCPKKKKNRS